CCSMATMYVGGPAVAVNAFTADGGHCERRHSTGCRGIPFIRILRAGLALAGKRLQRCDCLEFGVAETPAARARNKQQLKERRPSRPASDGSVPTGGFETGG